MTRQEIIIQALAKRMIQKGYTDADSMSDKERLSGWKIPGTDIRVTSEELWYLFRDPGAINRAAEDIKEKRKALEDILVYNIAFDGCSGVYHWLEAFEVDNNPKHDRLAKWVSELDQSQLTELTEKIDAAIKKIVAEVI